MRLPTLLLGAFAMAAQAENWPQFAWDPRADIFYASKMTKPTFKNDRSK